MKNALFLSIILCLPLLFISCASSGSSSGSSSASYDVNEKRNVNSVRITKVGDSNNRVEVVLKTRGSMTGSSASNVRIQGSSGTEQITSTFRGYDDVSFPFRGRVAFEYTKQKFDAVGPQGDREPIATNFNAAFSFEITEPGQWVVTAYY